MALRGDWLCPEQMATRGKPRFRATTIAATAKVPWTIREGLRLAISRVRESPNTAAKVTKRLGIGIEVASAASRGRPAYKSWNPAPSSWKLLPNCVPVKTSTSAPALTRPRVTRSARCTWPCAGTQIRTTFLLIWENRMCGSARRLFGQRQNFSAFAKSSPDRSRGDKIGGSPPMSGQWMDNCWSFQIIVRSAWGS